MLRQDIRGLRLRSGDSVDTEMMSKLPDDSKSTIINSNENVYSCRLDAMAIEFKTMPESILVTKISYNS